MDTRDIHPLPKYTCQDVQRDLVAYLKGGLSTHQQAAFRHHLLNCDHCAQSVQEARGLEAELRGEAFQIRRNIPPLSTAASGQIQEKVYRKMRRALWLQRSVGAAQRIGAVAVVLLFLFSVLVLFNPWRMQLASMGTASPVETDINENEIDSTGEREIQEMEDQPDLAESTPTGALLSDTTPVPTAITQDNQPVADPPSPPAPIMDRETPEDAARAIIDAAISADDQQFALVVERTKPLPEASFRVWRRLERCQGIVTADDLVFRVMVHRGRFASVYVFSDEVQYLGDIKMWLDRDGYWYLSSLNYSSFSSLKNNCSQ